MHALAKSPDERFATMGDLTLAILSTPEGAPFVRPSHGSTSDGRASSYPAPGVPTVAYFASPAGTLAATLPGAPPGAQSTAVFGTPGAQATAVFGTPGAATGRTTPLAAEAPTAAPARPRRFGLLLAALGVVTVGLGVGGYAAYTRASSAAVTGGEPARERSPAPEKQPAAVAAPPVEAVAAPTTFVAETTVLPVTAAPLEITLHVVTDPPAASLSKGGFEVCAATPCDVLVRRNEGVALEAHKGALRGLLKIMPQQEQTVTIPLVAPTIRPRAPAGPRMCEVEVDGLKILRACPN